MSKNTFKVEKPRKRSLFSKLEELLKLEKVLEKGVPAKYVPHFLFLTMLGIFYIGSSHFYDKNIRKIDKLEKEIKELRADYQTQKAAYMLASKQSEVVKKLEKQGIKESLIPPYKIEVQKEE